MTNQDPGLCLSVPAADKSVSIGLSEHPDSETVYTASAVTGAGIYPQKGETRSVLGRRWLGPSYTQLLGEFAASEPAHTQAWYLATLTARVCRLLGVEVPRSEPPSTIHGAVLAKAQVRAEALPSTASQNLAFVAQNHRRSSVASLQLDRARWFQHWLNEPFPVGEPLEIDAQTLSGVVPDQWALSLGVPTLVQIRIGSEEQAPWQKLLSNRDGWVTPQTAQRLRESGLAPKVDKVCVFDRIWNPPAITSDSQYARLSPAWGLACEALWVACQNVWSNQWSGVWRQASHDDVLIQIMLKLENMKAIRLIGVSPGRLYVDADDGIPESAYKALAQTLEPYGGCVINREKAIGPGKKGISGGVDAVRGAMIEKAKIKSWEQADAFVMEAETSLTAKAMSLIMKG